MLESFDKVSDDGNSFLLGQFYPFLYESFQITLIAEFRDDVAIVCSTVNIVAFEDIWMIKFF